MGEKKGHNWENSCWSLWRVGWSAVEGTKVLDYEKRKSELSLVGLKFLIIVTAFFCVLGKSWRFSLQDLFHIIQFLFFFLKLDK